MREFVQLTVFILQYDNCETKVIQFPSQVEKYWVLQSVFGKHLEIYLMSYLIVE